MAEKINYFVIKERAVPEVLRKVVETKLLLESGRCTSVAEATERTGISRSSFYKYKEDIFPFRENVRGKTLTLVITLEDEPGVLSDILQVVAEYHANILTIHQSIPVGGMASLTLSVDVLPETGDVAEMVESMENTAGIKRVKIIAKE